MKAELQRWLWLVTVLPAGTVFAAEPEHGLPQNAVKIEHWGGFITNTMVVSWVVAILLIIFARVAMRDMKVFGRAQNLLEWLVESLADFWRKSLGPPANVVLFRATIFIFILSAIG
jgi:F-type H+-transporting ATPase subunit a